MSSEFDERVCLDHSIRIRKLEARAAVTDNSIERLEKLPDLISTLRDAVVELRVWTAGQTATIKVQTRMMWAVVIIVLGAIISGAFFVIRSGVLAGVP